MLHLQVSNDIRLDTNKLPQKAWRVIARDLTLPNPSYLTAERMGKYTGNLAKYIRLYEVRDDTIIIPRGYIYRLLSLLKDTGQAYAIDDQRLLLPPVDFKSLIKLRDYQTPAADRLTKRGNGGLDAPCGSGKTQIMLEVTARLRQPALWITHTKELQQQLIERACSCFEGMKPEEIGIIADGKVSIGPRLTVALVQTLSKIDFAKISDKFGTVIVDEGHHIAATTFQDTVSRFPARYRLWCSATPEREDGLGKMVIASGGPIRYTIEDKDLPTVKPRLEIIESHYNGYLNVEDYAGMMTELVKNPGRNKLVVDIISHEAPGHYSLVLSDRIEHLVILKGRLAAALPTMRIEILTGQLPKKERTSIMEMAKAGRVDVLLATQLAREGLDLPHLDRLFLVSPKRAKGATQQEIGRIMRPCANKEDAVVFDFWDTQHPVFKAQFWKRRAVYQKLGIVVDFQSGMQRIPG